MKMRRVLLWVIPLVCIGLVVSLALMSAVIQNQEQAFDVLRQKGWAIYLQNFKYGGLSLGAGQRAGDILVDKAGKIWLAGLKGVHVFDGTQWINHEGHFSDLAVSPQGEIWAVPILQAAVHVYDGQQWKRYPINLGNNSYIIKQVEIDSRGRVWVTADHNQLAEIVQLEGKLIPKFSHPELSCGTIVSMDADKQGRIWAAVWGSSRVAMDYMLSMERHCSECRIKA